MNRLTLGVQMPNWLLLSWQWVSALAIILIDLIATAHVILKKRSNHAAIGWAGLIWFAPGVGSVLYYSFGINRIERKAKRLKRRRVPRLGNDKSSHMYAVMNSGPSHLTPLITLVTRLTGKELLTRNMICPLETGSEAYAQMLDAIDSAKHSIGLSTYIFDNDEVGKRFIDSLGRAAKRGVEVAVLIDDIGARYSWPWTVVGPLRQDGVKVVRFLPQPLAWVYAYANLRNHRKILVVDGKVGFTGGMNIRRACDETSHPKDPVVDLHFRLEGPVVAHLREVFIDDWYFCTSEVLCGEKWTPKLYACGQILARGIHGGPADDIELLKTVYLGGLALAKDSVRIVTPYFLPETALIAALNVAALRGVKVDIVLPVRSNLRLVQWACVGQLFQVLEQGCRVWFAPPPFDHSKLMIIDRTWVLFGSSNWDPRSLRLNFEFDVECYDSALAANLDDRVSKTIKKSKRVTLAQIKGRSLPVKLRDGFARLMTPYL